MARSASTPPAPRASPRETMLGLRMEPTSDANESMVPERTVTVSPSTEVTAKHLLTKRHQGYPRRFAALDKATP